MSGQPWKPPGTPGWEPPPPQPFPWRKLTIAALVVIVAATASYLSGSAFLAPLFGVAGIVAFGFLIVAGVRAIARR